MVIVGSDDLYLAVRAAFAARGTSLNAWCIANGTNRQTVEKSLRGRTHTRKAQELRDRVLAAAFPEGKSP